MFGVSHVIAFVVWFPKLAVSLLPSLVLSHYPTHRCIYGDDNEVLNKSNEMCISLGL